MNRIGWLVSYPLTLVGVLASPDMGAVSGALARAALDPWGGLAPAVPVPAGGMTLARVPELLDFYGTDVILLIGGNLLAARERLVEESRAFVNRVESYQHE